jgi:uroporphyrinogen-III synthase
MLVDAGGQAVSFPVIEISALELTEHERDLLRSWQQFDLALFISANAVSHALHYVDTTGDYPQIAAVGAKTAAAIVRAGLEVALVPEQGFNSEALLALTELQSIVGWRVLLLKGEGGRDLLREELQRRGAEVQEIDLYKRCMPSVDPEPVNRQGSMGGIDLVAVTSNEGLSNLIKLLGKQGHDWLLKTPLLAGSSRIAEQADRQGFEKIIVAANPGDESMFRAVLQWNQENRAEAHE